MDSLKKNSFNKLKNDEIRFILLISLIIFSLSGFVYFVAYIIKPNGTEFIGTTPSTLPNDYFTYLAWIKQASKGRFLFSFLYTIEDSGQFLFHPLFLILGWLYFLLNKITGISILIFPHLIRIIMIFILNTEIYKFLSIFFKKHNRKKAFIFSTLISGFGVYYFIFKLLLRHYYLTLPISIAPMPVDIWINEINVFRIEHGCFFFQFALLLFIMTLRLLLTGVLYKKTSSIIISALIMTILSFIHPYDIITLYPLIFIIIFYRSKTKQAGLTSIQGINKVFLLFFIPIFILISQYIIINTNNIVKSYYNGVKTYSPNFIWYFLGFGILFLLSLKYIVYYYKRYFKVWIYKLLTEKKRKENLQYSNFLIVFSISWLFIQIALLYLPVRFQNRLALGINIPLGILAFKGWKLYSMNHRIMASRTAFALLILIFFQTNTFNIISDIKYIRKKNIYFVDKRYLSLLVKLDKLTPDFSKTVIANDYFSKFIPIFSSCRTFLGHYDQSINIDKKKQEFNYLLNNNDPEFTMDFIQKYNPDFFILIPVAYKLKNKFFQRKLELLIKNDYSEIYRIIK